MGNFSRVFLSQAAGSRPLSLAVANSVWITAVRLPARSEPAKSQFFLPIAIGRIIFSLILIAILSGSLRVSPLLQGTKAGYYA